MIDLVMPIIGSASGAEMSLSRPRTTSLARRRDTHLVLNGAAPSPTGGADAEAGTAGETAKARAKPIDFRQAERMIAARLLDARFSGLETETRSANWDFERGEAIGEDTWKAAREVALLLRDLRIVPDVNPCGDGSVHLQWRPSESVRFTLEVVAPATDITLRERRTVQGGRRTTVSRTVTVGELPTLLASLRA